MPAIFPTIGLLAVLSAFEPAPVRAAEAPLPDQAQASLAKGTWVTGYYPAQNRVEPIADIPWTKYTEVNHFAAAPGVGSDGRGNGTVSLHYLTAAEIGQFVAQAHAAGVKAVVTIMDNGRHPDAFRQNAAPETIEAFVRSVEAFVISNAYDGVDIDWEARVSVPAYVDWLRRLRNTLGPSKLISVAVGNWSQLERVAAQAQAQVDHINIMCYDMDDTRSYAWHNAALLQDGDAEKMTCDWRVRAFTQAGVSRSKLGIGIPFYGRRWTGVTEPRRAGGARSAGWVNYRDLVTDKSRWQPEYQKWDSKYRADYLSIPALQEFDSFNGVRSVAEICRWARTERFGGFMAFDLSYEYLAHQTGDARYPLSTALWEAAHASTPSGPQSR